MKSGITHRAPSDLVAGYLPLVNAAAARFRQQVASQTEWDDLVADGLLALRDAAKRCGPNQPVRFATYAKQRIRGAILDRLKKQYSAPRSFRSRKPQNAIPMPIRSSGTTLNEGHLESEFGMTLCQLENALAARSQEVRNRRKEPRGGTNQSVKVTVLADPQVLLRGHIVDVSGNGMKLFLPDAISAGSAIEVECEDCTFRAKVVYCLFHPRPNGTGHWWIGIQIVHRSWELVEPLARPKTTTAG
jgi:RNA polymerase sigma factor (sigma-70 family)